MSSRNRLYIKSGNPAGVKQVGDYVEVWYGVSSDERYLYCRHSNSISRSRDDSSLCDGEYMRGVLKV